MEMRLCPDCKRAFFYQLNNAPYTCPHCDYIFLKKRAFERTQKSVRCVFYFKGATRSAKTIDYSRGGVSVEYSGKPLPQNTFLDFHSNALDIHIPVRTVWSRAKNSRKAMAGLKFLRAVKTL